MLGFSAQAQNEKDKITIGSKMHGESYLLAEIMAQLLENNDYEVDRKFGFGGTLICYNALLEGEIDIYPEYTGTISEAIFTADEKLGENPTLDDYEKVLNANGMTIFAPFGFSNSYAIAIKGTLAKELNINTISDLANHPGLKVSFSHEFLNRDDGWLQMKTAFGLNFEPTGIQHGLAYKAIDEGAIDLTDAFSTDGDIERYGLVTLTDDLNYFPKYYGVSFTKLDFPLAAKTLLSKLENTLDDNKMRALNAEVSIEKKSFSQVANTYLIGEGFIPEGTGTVEKNGLISQLIKNTMIHIQITLIALSLGCVVGLVAAFMIFRNSTLSRSVIYVTGLLQTIPSIALLALMIPIFGIGEIPAIIALFLYSLLPILRSAITALSTIDPVLVNVSRAIGMTRYQQLKNVLFPLALPNILSGIKTATIICIGTATLAAFIGAGGLGEPIVTGLALNDTNLILQGAIPAACLAIIVEILFEVLEKRIIPEHMRTSS
ncbi:MAG: glycine betaine ABC transporter substrate-binding protein [Emcibacteraceae bacterium]|nr:glycine betaine ABC transporter substrate-binding protein [Emcibacteraceae bacterium]